MKDQNKKVIFGVLLCFFGLLTILLAIITSTRGSVYLPGYGIRNGEILSIEKDGTGFYLVPGIQAIVAVLFLVGGLLLIKDSKIKSS